MVLTRGNHSGIVFCWIYFLIVCCNQHLVKKATIYLKHTINKSNVYIIQDSAAVSEASAHGYPASTSGYHHPCLPQQQFCPRNCPEGYLTGSGGCQFCICYQGNVTGQFVIMQTYAIKQTVNSNCSHDLCRVNWQKCMINIVTWIVYLRNLYFDWINNKKKTQKLRNSIDMIAK